MTKLRRLDLNFQEINSYCELRDEEIKKRRKEGRKRERKKEGGKDASKEERERKRKEKNRKDLKPFTRQKKELSAGFSLSTVFSTKDTGEGS